MVSAAWLYIGSSRILEHGDITMGHSQMLSCSGIDLKSDFAS